MTSKLGQGVGQGHGGNTANLPMIRELPPGPHLLGLEPGARAFKAGKLTIFIGQHPTTGAWHLSISRPDRYPTWDEIAYARYNLIPETAWMIMALPPKSDYVNLHNFCFHLHEIPYDLWNGPKE